MLDTFAINKTNVALLFAAIKTIGSKKVFDEQITETN